MRRALSYTDALRILGGGDSPLLTFLDRASAVGLLAAGGFNFMEARAQLVKLGGDVIAGLGARLRGADRVPRTERLLAAHTVIVVTAYFEELEPVLRRFGSGQAPKFSVGDELSLAGGAKVDADWRGLTESLAQAGIVKPDLMGAHETAAARLESYYQHLSAAVGDFLSGLAIWDALHETQREALQDELGRVLPSRAVSRYQELFARLAVDCAEFRLWAGLGEHRATRSEVRAGLASLEAILVDMSEGRLRGTQMAALSRAYQAALHKPITLSSDVPADLQMPRLGEGYIDHRFRVAEVVPSSQPGWDSWWNGLPVRSDIHRFLAAYLTSGQALEAPLLVLGQPGSGKSVLTRVLAARLPQSEFLPVRVELRQVPAEAEVQDQIEHAVRLATGESLQWPRLVESAGGALPVVFLDGFDELLQATGVAHTDFLLKVADFQEREADQGRPVAIVVTSRIAVTDRAALPQGATALRLEPFDEAQMAAWLEVWHRINDASLARRGLKRLALDCVLLHRELAEQPLLLLMLALYDAHDNALQRESRDFDRTELYERLLQNFARREVRKQLDGLPEAELDRAVEAELLRLSVVAFAMFNRRSQWVGEEDLNRDLAALLLDSGESHAEHGFRAPLTFAERVVGRFFFVHEAQATRDGRQVQSYEFLHATFGEYLVARLVVRILADMVNRERAASSLIPAPLDDGLLHALLSFAVLTARAPAVAFCKELIDRLPPDTRAVLEGLLLRLHRRALRPRAASAYADYEPRPVNVTVRCAAWSANLVLLATIVGGEVTASRLFPDAEQDAAFAWRDQAMMWRSQLSSEEWSGLVGTLALERQWNGDRREIRLWIDDGSFRPEPPDIRWTYFTAPDDAAQRTTVAWLGHTPAATLRKSNFTGGKTDDVLAHALQPLGLAFPSLANCLVPMPSGEWVSASNALLDALTAPFRPDADKAEALWKLMHVVRNVANGVTSADSVTFIDTAFSVLLSAMEQSTTEELMSLVHPLLSDMVMFDMVLADGGLRSTALRSRLLAVRERITVAAIGQPINAD